MKIKFELENESLLNKLFLRIEYMSGDADAYEYEEVEIPEVNYTNYKEPGNLKKISELVKKYQLVGNLTDCNHPLCVTWRPESNPKLKKYKDEHGWLNVDQYVTDTYGEEIADLLGNVPRDVTCSDYKACLRDLELIAYDELGRKFKSYI